MRAVLLLHTSVVSGAKIFPMPLRRQRSPDVPRHRQGDPGEARSGVLIRPKEKMDDQPVLEYLQYFKRIMKVNGWTEDTAGDIFLALLGPKDRTGALLEGTWSTFSELEELLLKQEEPMREANLNKLMNLILEDESVEKLRDRVVYLVGLVYGKASSEIQAQIGRDHFLYALPQTLREKILSGRPKSFEDTVSMAASLQSSVTSVVAPLQSREGYTQRSRSDSNKRPIVCYRCKKVGHIARNCNVRISEIAEQETEAKNFSRLPQMEGVLRSREILPPNTSLPRNVC